MKQKGNNEDDAAGGNRSTTILSYSKDYVMSLAPVRSEANVSSSAALRRVCAGEIELILRAQRHSVLWGSFPEPRSVLSGHLSSIEPL